MPNGTAGAYTTVMAEQDFGVLIDGTNFADWSDGLKMDGKSYITVRGIRFKCKQSNLTNQPIDILNSNHIKIIRCGASYGPTADNAASVNLGPACAYCLVEECYAYGGARYQFLIYQSDHNVIRRSVGRCDYWTGTLQCANFCNYDSYMNAFQNDIAVDSNYANLGGSSLYGGWYFENKPQYSVPAYNTDDTCYLDGNILINIQSAIYGAGLLDRVTGLHEIKNLVILKSNAGYNSCYPSAGTPTVSSTVTALNWTTYSITGSYASQDGYGGGGVSFGNDPLTGNKITCTIKNSVLMNCAAFGLADTLTSSYNCFYGNGAPTGASYGYTAPAIGTGSITATNPLTSGVKYPCRTEAGSALATTGQGGTPMGAQVMYKIGVSGTLFGETGWNVTTGDRLWPFPNETQIKSDMASYTGSGGAGTRGFCAAGNGLSGKPITLTSYIWEAMGSAVPADIYGN